MLSEGEYDGDGQDSRLETQRDDSAYDDCGSLAKAALAQEFLAITLREHPILFSRPSGRCVYEIAAVFLSHDSNDTKQLWHMSEGTPVDTPAAADGTIVDRASSLFASRASIEQVRPDESDVKDAEQVLETHEILELTAFIERKAWIEEKIQVSKVCLHTESLTALCSFLNLCHQSASLRGWTKFLLARKMSCLWQHGSSWRNGIANTTESRRKQKSSIQAISRSSKSSRKVRHVDWLIHVTDYS